MILVDSPRWPRDGIRYAHLASDFSHDELHRFVARLDLARPLRFHRDHYDVPAQWWEQAVAAGAQVVSARELVRRVRAAGLRHSR